MNSAHPSDRQTLSYLRNLFAERGIRPKNKLGQNFLIDLNLLDLLLRSGELTGDDLALEVGSGTGGLTVRLAEQAGAVVSVEVDPAFAVLTREAVEAYPFLSDAGEGTGGRRDRVVLLHGDVLRNKNELSPEVLGALSELAGRAG